MILPALQAHTGGKTAGATSHVQTTGADKNIGVAG